MNNPILLFYPEPLKPVPSSRVSKVCKEHNIPFHNDPLKPYDLHIFWSYTPRCIVPDAFTLTDKDVINRGCWDIGKQKVNDIFNDISIDPETHVGLCVEKWDMQGRNGRHHLITCPARRREGFIYQRYIRDKKNGLFVKYRIFYADGIDFILLSKKKGVFDSEYICSENVIVNKEDFFTPESEALFNENCRRFGIDYGDIEFMSDNGEPVIIDVNNVAGDHLPIKYFGERITRRKDNVFLNFIKRRYARIKTENP